MWLDDRHDDPQTGNPYIRCGIPGYKGCEKLKPSQDGQILVEPNNAGISLKDQVDVFLFTTCAAILLFLNDEKQRKFVKYPSSLFRIVTNRRLFVGEEKEDGVTVLREENGLCTLLKKNPLWQFVFPSIMVFHGSSKVGLQKLTPNITCTSNKDDCMSFVAFGSVMSAASGSDGLAP